MSRGIPYHIINRFWLADAVRVTKERIAGACTSVRNLMPKIGGGERVRTGYKSYTDIAAESGSEILKVVPVSTPSQEDVHIWFATSGIYINPWWAQGASKKTTNLLINEKFDIVSQAVTYSGFTMTFTSPPAGLNATVDYYKGWTMIAGGITFQITAWNGTDILTFIENIAAAGRGTPLTATMYRHFHENPTFVPSYNNDLVNPPVVNSENSIIRLSGGQSATVGKRGVWGAVINRTFFGSSSKPFTYNGTYFSERELKDPAKSILLSAEIGSTTVTAGEGLDKNKTYWIAIAGVYDGFQIGELSRFEDTVNEYQMGISDWSNNFLPNTAGTTSAMLLRFSITIGLLSKRLTGFAVYLARDDGDTRTVGRLQPYEFVAYVPITSTNGLGNSWAFDGVNVYTQNLVIKQSHYQDKGNAYIQDSGIIEIPPDIMYSYSTEEIIGTRRFLTNCYVTSETFVDRQNVFTNPEQGNATIGNIGILAPDLFSNEAPTYRLRVQPTLGTRINALIASGIEELLVLKDKGILLGRVITIDTEPEIMWTIIDEHAGTTTPNAWFRDDEEWIYFPSYTDIYRYRGGVLERLVERQDKNDWLNTYRQSITYTDKENASCFWLQEMRCGIFCFGNQKVVATGFNSMQYLLSPEFGWREIRFKEGTPTAGVANQTFKWTTKLRNGDTIGSTTDSTVGFHRFSWDRSVDPPQLVFTDAGTAIVPYFRTGAFIVASQKNQRYGDESRDFVWQHFFLNRDLDGNTVTTGTLELKLRDELTNAYVRTNLTKTVKRLPFYCIPESEPKIFQTMDIEYNSNADPERILSGTALSIDSLELFGIDIPRVPRISEEITQQALLCEVGVGTIGGKFEFLIVTENTWQVFTFDTPFTTTYVSANGSSTEPTWRFAVHTARTGTGVDVAQADILIRNRTLSSFEARSPEANTLVMYGMTKT